MAIYNRFGDKLVIVQKCGEHQPKGFTAPVMLVGVKFDDEGENHLRYQFAEALKADGGWQEIKSAVDAATLNVVSGSSLVAAIQQAL